MTKKLNDLSGKITILVFIFLITFLNFGCEDQNHIEKYEVNLDSLKTLPDAFYAYRRGRVFFEDGQYRIWLTRDNSGDIKNIFNIQDFADQNATWPATIKKYKIDTTQNKILIQKFIALSRKYKFGHINVDKSNKISFSYQDGLPEQYVRTFNDSLKSIYLKNNDFRLLNNGWFEYIQK